MIEPGALANSPRSSTQRLRTIRFYEDRGLLTPQRQGTARIFHDRDRVRLQLILRGKRLGLHP